MTARTWLGRTLAAALSLAVSQVSLPVAMAGEHLVDSGTLAQRLIDGARTREEKVALFQEALGRPEVRQQARRMGVSADKLARALPHLSDAELADLSARAAGVRDVTAGHRGGNDGMAVLGLLLLVAAVVVLVAAAGYEDGYYDDCYCY